MEKFCSECGAELVNGVCPKCNNNNYNFSNDGIINKKAIKEKAKLKIKGNIWNIMLPYIVLSLITSVLTSILYIGSNTNVYDDTYGDIVSMVVSFITIPITFGVTYYIVNLVRGKKVELNDIFRYLNKNVINIFLLSILISIFVFLWSLLFIIPGIIVALSYSMCEFIYVDGIKSEPMDVIKESKSLMDGYKSDYFIFNLSFMGWFILCILIFPIIYVLPYYSTCKVLYYDELKKIKYNK